MYGQWQKEQLMTWKFLIFFVALDAPFEPIANYDSISARKVILQSETLADCQKACLGKQKCVGVLFDQDNTCRVVFRTDTMQYKETKKPFYRLAGSEFCAEIIDPLHQYYRDCFVLYSICNNPHVHVHSHSIGLRNQEVQIHELRYFLVCAICTPKSSCIFN